MQSSPRRKFNTSQDWNNLLSSGKQLSGHDIFEFRINCYKDIEEFRGVPKISAAHNITGFIDRVSLTTARWLLKHVGPSLKGFVQFFTNKNDSPRAIFRIFFKFTASNTTGMSIATQPQCLPTSPIA